MSSPISPLDHEQIVARLCTMVVRNHLEDLHAGSGPISDPLMRQINQRVRDGVYTTLHALKWERRSLSAAKCVDYHWRSIPAYWEAPALIPGYRDSLEPETDGAEPVAIDERSAEFKTAADTVRSILDRLATRPEGRALRGLRGSAVRRRLLRYGIDRCLKLSPSERRESSRLSYLEFDLAERLRASGARGRGSAGGAAPSAAP